MNLLSIDLEDWYTSYESSEIPVSRWASLESRIEYNTMTILDFLECHGQAATFYVLGWVAERHPGLIRRIAAMGHEIGYHSWDHVRPLRQGSEAFGRDLERGVGAIASACGHRPLHYRAPGFMPGNVIGWMIPRLIRHGFASSSSFQAWSRLGRFIVPGKPFYFHTPEGSLPEFPLHPYRIAGLQLHYSGGGYFRMLPRRLLLRLYRRSNYHITYFHPRDFDPRVPHTSMQPVYRYLMNRLGNASTIPKLSTLLKEHKFITTGEAVKELASQGENQIIQTVARQAVKM